MQMCYQKIKKPGKRLLSTPLLTMKFFKLMEMGCVPGEQVTVDQIAPLKDPISIIVAGTGWVSAEWGKPTYSGWWDLIFFMKIGLFSVSFNPIHHSHLIIANHCHMTGSVDEVWFVVSPQNPFKRKTNTLLNENHRYHLVQLAIEGEKN